MLKIIVNPAFIHLHDFIASLPFRFETEGRSIYKARNEIKIFEAEGLVLNVKSYKIPILINRIAYTFLRPSKAKRAYEHALEVLEKGFETPEPIACIEEYDRGLLGRSFFISIQSSLSWNMYDFKNDAATNAGMEELTIAFARYSAGLHDAGILHRDYSSGNILYDKIDGEYHFSLIDINRMKFCPVDEDTACHNFCRLCGNDDFFLLFATEYAKVRNFDVENTVKKIIRFRDQDRVKRDRKSRKREKRRKRLNGEHRKAL